MVQRYLSASQQQLLDPFAGTGTTPLYAAYQGLEATALEINPFLVWFIKVKTAIYDEHVVDELRAVGKMIVSRFDDNSLQPVAPPPISNIERWWPESALRFLRSVKGGIEEYRQEATSNEVLDLLYVCFCRILIEISNAAFNHQSISFADDRQLHLFDERSRYKTLFLRDIEFVAASALENPVTVPRIIQGDARNVASHVQAKMDLVITSPPYPNRMSYIRELRPYMYWLGYLDKAREAGELDWQAIGGTWGIATSRLSEWTQSKASGYYPEYFQEILDRIRDSSNKHGAKMANYVARYFEDIWQHFNSLVTVLHTGASVHYVVGNSTFYGVLLPVERLYKEIMELTGFSATAIEVVRKRNSKKELYEFTVSGKYL
ncbi:MAG: DNA methyltransferase [Anaerolineae bacterium]|nr:DNA methyltransferase [Anaerolineae bacterium]